jgi:hypothetical protein
MCKVNLKTQLVEEVNEYFREEQRKKDDAATIQYIKDKDRHLSQWEIDRLIEKLTGGETA